MELTEQAEFRTGPIGTIQFVIPPGQTVSVERLTTLKVDEPAKRQGGKKVASVAELVEKLRTEARVI